MCWNSSCLSIICYSFYNTLIFSFFLSSHLSLVFISTVRYCLTMLPSSSQFHAFSTTSLYLVFQFFFPSSHLSFSIFSITLPLTYSLLSRTQASQRRGGKNHMNTMNHSSPSTFFSLSYLLLPHSLHLVCKDVWGADFPYACQGRAALGNSS